MAKDVKYKLQILSYCNRVYFFSQKLYLITMYVWSAVTVFSQSYESAFDKQRNVAAGWLPKKVSR